MVLDDFVIPIKRGAMSRYFFLSFTSLPSSASTRTMYLFIIFTRSAGVSVEASGISFFIIVRRDGSWVAQSSLVREQEGDEGLLNSKKVGKVD